MTVFLLTEVLDQSIVQGEQEIIWASSSVMLLRVEPARRDIGVPRQHHLSLRLHGPDVGGHSSNKRQRHRARAKGGRCQYGPSGQLGRTHRILLDEPSLSNLELDVLPGIGVCCGYRREHVLPFRGFDAWPDRIYGGMTE